MTRTKPLMPSLREKKRYVAFEIISKGKIGFTEAKKAIIESCLRFMGELGFARAGIQVLSDTYKDNKGIIRTTIKETDKVKTSLALIKQIDGNDVIVRSIRTSGIIGKAKVYT